MLHAACIQLSSRPGDVKANLAKADRLISQAKQAGAELVVLPELFNVGYDFDILKNLKYDDTETRVLLANKAQEAQVYIAAGLLETAEAGWYNSLVVFTPAGTVSGVYRKANLFPLSKEEETFTPGTDFVTVTIGELTFGLMICFDLRFPEIGRLYLEQGCTGLLIASAFPFPRLDHWRTLLQARAVENQMYVVAANRAGRDGAFHFLGNSCIIDPWGTVKATANETEEGFIMHQLELARVEEVRKTIPCQANVRRLRELGACGELGV